MTTLCGKNMGNDLLIIPCDLPNGHEGNCERNTWPVNAPRTPLVTDNEAQTHTQETRPATRRCICGLLENDPIHSYEWCFGGIEGAHELTLKPPEGVMKPYYEHAGITIYHGDCRDILPQLPKVDLVLTDPPYGIGEAAGKNRSRGKAFGGSLAAKNTRNRIVPARDYGCATWDDSPPPQEVIEMLRGAGRSQIIWGGNFFSLPPSSCWLVWDKDNSGDFADCELAWTNLKKAVRRIIWRWNGMLQEDMSRKEHRVHPTQKPLPVMKWAIRQAPEDCEIVLDPYTGSGTILVAAKMLGKSAIGIEIEEKYCEIAAKRLSQEVFQFEESNGKH